MRLMPEPAEPTPAERYLYQDALVVRRRTGGRWLWLAAGVLLVLGLAWWLTHPSGFSDAGSFEDQAPVGQSRFFRVLGPSSGDARTLEIKSATARVLDAPEGTETEVLLCRGAAISTTADAHAFCGDLQPAAGQTLHYGRAVMEQLVLRITSPSPGTVTVDGVTVRFSEGLQLGSAVVGPKITLSVLDR